MDVILRLGELLITSLRQFKINFALLRCSDLCIPLSRVNFLVTPRDKGMLAIIASAIGLLLTWGSPIHAQVQGGIAVNSAVAGSFTVETVTTAGTTSASANPAICNPPSVSFVVPHEITAQTAVTAQATACITYLNNILQGYSSACPAGNGSTIYPIVAGPWYPVAVDPAPGSAGGGSGGYLTSAGFFSGSLYGEMVCSGGTSTTIVTAQAAGSFTQFWCYTGQYPILDWPSKNECSTAPTLDASLYDPIADNLASGSGLVSSPTQLAAASHLVRGVAADNATQALVEITGAGVSAGDSIQLTLSDENGPSGNGASAGYLTALPANGMDSRTSNGVISIQAVSVPGKGTAFGFAAFHAPTDFVRALNSSDPGAIDRILTIKATDTTNNSTTTISVFVVRPPVVFVHGIWGSPRDFFASDGGVAAATSFTGWQVHYAQYNHFVALSSSVPAYPGAPLLIQGNSLGFLYGAGQVLPQIRSAITDYKPNNGGGVAIASTQVDVVAHSMGGDVVRFLPQLSGFAGQDTYNLGYVHKLISIDTPHLGSPLASSLLDPRNTCAAQVLAMAGKYAFNSANINGNVNVNGAVGDLQPTSAAIASMQSGAALIPTAMIGGQMTSTQTNGAGSAWEARVLVALCGNSYNNDPLAAELNPAGWTNLLSQYNDAIVSLASQFDNDLAYSVSTPGPGQNTFPAIHSPGANALGFLPPLIMDEASGAPAEVVNLLNTPVSNSAIFVVKP